MISYNFNQVSKTLEKIFKAGYTNEKSILAIQLDDLEKIPDITSVEISVIIALKRAIKSKKIIEFLSIGFERKERNDKNEQI